MGGYIVLIYVYILHRKKKISCDQYKQNSSEIDIKMKQNNIDLTKLIFEN
jgi:hypothetical protein